MGQVIEFVAKTRVRRSPDATADAVRRAHPGLSEGGVIEVVRGLLFRDPPRFDGLVVHLFGADILSADPATIPAWPLIHPSWRDSILTGDEAARRKMIDPEDLTTTYVWCAAGNWVQEVSDVDVEVIRRSHARTWFRDPTRFGAFTPPRAFDFPVIETVPIADADDLRQFRREQRRRPQWTGR